MLFESGKGRAQTSVEYMLALAMTVVLVAAIMVTGLRELELDLALSAARMGGTDFTAANSNYTLGKVGFQINESTNTVDVTPYFYLRQGNMVPPVDAYAAGALCFLKMRSVFKPDETGVALDYCFDAPYRRYCVWPVMVP